MRVSMRLDDPSLDTCEPADRDAALVDAVRRQIAFMRDSVPFWTERLEAASIDESQLGELSDLGRFPVLEKAEFRGLPPGELLPASSSGQVEVCRWTSGTTGRPTVSMWTKTDWAGLVVSAARMLRPQSPMQAPTVFNGYGQGHLTGPMYHAALQRLGGTVYDRGHHPEEQFSTTEQMSLFEFDTLVLPEQTLRGKGVGLAELLAGNPDLLKQFAVRWWVGSSGGFTEDTVSKAKGQGVESVSNLYGSSEFGVFAISCLDCPGDYHVAQGYVLVEVVDNLGVQVESGQSGRLVVTRLSGADITGQSEVHRGSQIFRLANGDGATLVEDPCSCGLTTVRLRNVHRLTGA